MLGSVLALQTCFSQCNNVNIFSTGVLPNPAPPEALHFRKNGKSVQTEGWFTLDFTGARLASNLVLGPEGWRCS